MYEDYLEEFVFKTAKLIAEKLFGRKSSSAPEKNASGEREALIDSSDLQSNESEENIQLASNTTSNVTEGKDETTNQEQTDEEEKIQKEPIESTSKAAETEAKGGESNALAKCNTYDLLCSQMKDEIAEQEKRVQEEENHVATKEGKFCKSLLILNSFVISLHIFIMYVMYHLFSN